MHAWTVLLGFEKQSDNKKQENGERGIGVYMVEGYGENCYLCPIKCKQVFIQILTKFGKLLYVLVRSWHLLSPLPNSHKRIVGS